MNVVEWSIYFINGKYIIRKRGSVELLHCVGSWSVVEHRWHQALENVHNVTSFGPSQKKYDPLTKKPTVQHRRSHMSHHIKIWPHRERVGILKQRNLITFSYFWITSIPIVQIKTKNINKSTLQRACILNCVFGFTQDQPSVVVWDCWNVVICAKLKIGLSFII